MAFNHYTIIAPSLNDTPCHDAMLIGSAVWLWMQSAQHRHAELCMLPTQLLPALQRKQFVLMFDPKGQPVVYLAWAYFNAETEQAYLGRGHQVLLDTTNWCNGDRLWMLDWIAPHGHTRSLSSWAKTALFPDQVLRFLHHRGEMHGARIIETHGHSITRADARQWHSAHPIFTDIPLRQFYRT